jgi:8-hydroxy-5-deazaflavin:NADPH oxidoreductase
VRNHKTKKGNQIMKSKIGIIGSGNVGSALQRGLVNAGYSIQVSNEDNVRDITAGSEIIILAVPFTAIDDVLKKLGDSIDGKILIDATNALTADMKLALGYSTSGAEELQKKAPKAKVVKCFNTVFAQHMDTGKVNGQTLSVFAASDDQVARDQVLKIASDIGFDAINAGPLENARHLEPLAFFNIQLGYVLGNGVNIGFKFIS